MVDGTAAGLGSPPAATPPQSEACAPGRQWAGSPTGWEERTKGASTQPDTLDKKDSGTGLGPWRRKNPQAVLHVEPKLCLGV